MYIFSTFDFPHRCNTSANVHKYLIKYPREEGRALSNGDPEVNKLTCFNLATGSSDSVRLRLSKCSRFSLILDVII